MITLTTRHKLFLARRAQSLIMAVRRASGRGPEVAVARRGIRWQLDLSEGIDFAIWLFGAFEPRTLRHYLNHLKPGNVALDIGANIGAHTLHLALSVGSTGRVLAFEPTDYAFGKLKANVALNPDLAARVAAHQVMLTDNSLPAPVPAIYSSWPLEPEGGGTHLLHGGLLKSCASARAATLDELMEIERVNRIDLVKLDIDGYECAMLRGAIRTLARFQPSIIMEIAPYVLREHGSGVAELVEILGATGYALRDIETRRSLPLDAHWLESAIPIGGGRNVIAYRAH